jgi:hypothetical protein
MQHELGKEKYKYNFGGRAKRDYQEDLELGERIIQK